MAKKPIGKVSRAVKDKCIEALISLQAFETYWAYYRQSSGQVYEEQTKEAAKLLVDKFIELSAIYPRIKDLEELSPNPSGDYFDWFFSRIEKWLETGVMEEEGGRNFLRASILELLPCLKVHLLQVINLDCWPPIIISAEPYSYTLEVQQWKPHVPSVYSIVRLEHPNEFKNLLNKSDSIVVVADIRRSQDLMTYASSPEDFSERLNVLLQTGREMLSAHNGIFDKFTGDGLIAYFSPAVTEKDKSYIDCFISFCYDFLSFCKEHFDAWNKTVHKQPHTLPGIAIGADLGQISFDIKGGHLIAVGSPIVWASRLASVAKSGEVAINNCLWTALLDKRLEVSDREGVTKSGEEFLARIWTP